MAQFGIIQRTVLGTALLSAVLSFLRWYAGRLRRRSLSSQASLESADRKVGGTQGALVQKAEEAPADVRSSSKDTRRSSSKDTKQEPTEERSSSKELNKDADAPQFERQLSKQEEIVQNDEFLNLILLMSKIPSFVNLDHAEYALVAKAFSRRTYTAGQIVKAEDDVDNELFVVAHGEANMLTAEGSEHEHQVSLMPGNIFGEQAFLREQKHQATVTAKTELQVHVLSRDAFDKLDISTKLYVRKKRAKFQTVADKSLRFSLDAKLTRKTAEQHDFIKKAILANQELGTLLSHLDSDELDDIVDHAFSMEVNPGSSVITQGEITTDLFYVIAEGGFDVIVREHEVGKLGPGHSFGELALLFRAPRAATVRATTAAKLWAVHRYYLKPVLQKPLKKKLEEYATLLGQVELFKSKSESERSNLADALVATTYYKDECIIHQGEEGDRFFVLYDGEVSVNIDGKEVSRLKSLPGDGVAQFFGERALLKNEPRAASIITVSEKAKVLALERDTFLHVLKGEDKEKQLIPESYIEYSRKNLQEIGLLGSGGFGAVTLVKDSATGLTFALKALSKGHVVKHAAQRSVMNEKIIMRITSNPFLIRLAATFNSDQYLYFLIEPALGGDLITVYEQHNLHRSEQHAKFYLACVLRALEHLHSRYIVYRDLKPENLLIDNNGYCKVADFGLSKFVIGHTYTTCGTPEFFAPEIITGGGYTKAVDWWALGAMTFEFMTGQSPFYDCDHMSVMKRIKEGVIRFPLRAQDWPDLVRCLCMQDPSERLPLRKGGSANVENHTWFSKDSFDWASFNERKMVAPYVPKVQSCDDISNFEAYEEDKPREVKYKDNGTGWDADFEDVWGPSIFN